MTEKGSSQDPGPSREHWESIYGTRAEDEVSWFQARPSISLELIRHADVGLDGRIIDIGAGASRLVDALLDAGHRQLTVLDIAEGALDMARRRLGARVSAVTWIAADVTSWDPGAAFDLWHDRAVYHFMVRLEARRAYLATMRRALRGGGHAIIGTFASDGPERCSGLPVMRYEPEALAAELGPEFRLVESVRDEHLTPGGKIQPFQFSRFVRARGRPGARE